jgi:hypothetical protein
MLLIQEVPLRCDRGIKWLICRCQSLPPLLRISSLVLSCGILYSKLILLLLELLHEFHPLKMLLGVERAVRDGNSGTLRLQILLSAHVLFLSRKLVFWVFLNDLLHLALLQSAGSLGLFCIGLAYEAVMRVLHSGGRLLPLLFRCDFLYQLAEL